MIGRWWLWCGCYTRSRWSTPRRNATPWTQPSSPGREPYPPRYGEERSLHLSAVPPLLYICHQGSSRGTHNPANLDVHKPPVSSSRGLLPRAKPPTTTLMVRVGAWWWPWRNTPPTPPLNFVRLPLESLTGPSSRNVARPSVSANAWWSCTSRDARPDTWRARLASVAPRC